MPQIPSPDVFLRSDAQWAQLAQTRLSLDAEALSGGFRLALSQSRGGAAERREAIEQEGLDGRLGMVLDTPPGSGRAALAKIFAQAHQEAFGGSLEILCVALTWSRAKALQGALADFTQGREGLSLSGSSASAFTTKILGDDSPIKRATLIWADQADELSDSILSALFKACAASGALSRVALCADLSQAAPAGNAMSISSTLRQLKDLAEFNKARRARDQIAQAARMPAAQAAPRKNAPRL